MQRIKDAAEQAKKELSATDQTQIMLPYLAQVKGEPVHMDLTLTRAQFERLVSDLIDRTEGPVRSALSDAGISPAPAWPGAFSWRIYPHSGCTAEGSFSYRKGAVTKYQPG